MSIDIDQFTEAELINLNRRIVERLRFLQQMRAHSAMLKFSVGDRVCFDTDGFRRVTGTLVRYNKKTVRASATKSTAIIKLLNSGQAYPHWTEPQGARLCIRPLIVR